MVARMAATRPSFRNGIAFKGKAAADRADYFAVCNVHQAKILATVVPAKVIECTDQSTKSLQVRPQKE
jgi:hypothetical protein